MSIIITGMLNLIPNLSIFVDGNQTWTYFSACWM